MYPQFINLVNEFEFFNENFNSNYTCFFNDSYKYFLHLNNLSAFLYLTPLTDVTLYTDSIISFINQTEDLNLNKNIENITTIYHYSIPNTKLSYPEPFIAAPSFMHSDLWFVHILVYQYWLWFVFVFIIVFFFITFVSTVRWCNMRVRPRRETRGVSRSKCGDLITACVPVTWATSIIVNESTDAIDYYDGFGTTELVVGIRAYQWGWEYYYPKDIDLNYNVKQNYSTFVGNSLKYDKTSDVNLKANNLWKFYQNKVYDQVVTPAHLLTLPIDNYKMVNFLNFQDIGSSSIQEANAFKKTKMFSKINPLNLIHTQDSLSYKYQNFKTFFLNENQYSESYLYGLKRQHNFLSSKSFFNNQKTFFNLNSVNKIVNFNFNFRNSDVNKSNSYNTYSYFKKLNTNSLTYDGIQSLSSLFQYAPTLTTSNYNNFLLFNKTTSFINDNSDKKNLHYPLFKLFNSKLKNKLFKNKLNSGISNSNNLNDLNILNVNEVEKFFEIERTYKTSTTFSSNQSILLPNRYNRNFLNVSSNKTNFNHSLFLNPVNEYLNQSSTTSGLSSNDLSRISSSNWISPSITQKLSTTKNYFDYPYSPVASNHPSISSNDYDNLKNSFVDETPTVLQGKEELMPAFLSNIYWNFYWTNSTPDWRFSNLQNYNSIHQFHYLPLFSFYYDYDFRNWQAVELLEDSFWESIYSVYTHDEYSSLVNEFYNSSLIDKLDNAYNAANRENIYSSRLIEKPLFLKNLNFEDRYANPFYLDDFVHTPDLVATKNFYPLTAPSSVSSSLDESYDSLKYLNYLFNLNNSLFLNNSTNYINSHSFFFIFDSFRSDYDEFSWFIDDSNKKELNNFNLVNSSNYSLSDDLQDIDLQLFRSYDDPDLVNYESNRFSNHVNLRSSTKSSIVTYNAIQKVFKTRFDESRSNTKLADFGYFYNKQNFISSPRVQYEKLLGKTKENFFTPNLYKSIFVDFLNNNYALITGLNYYFFDFPFLLAMKSDSSRYLWFDWYAKWGFYEVQPSSSSRYAIYGMPYLSKNFEFSTINGENLNESETYLLRISRARRNYLPNWVYTPYFYSKHTNWYKTNLFYEIFDNYNNSLTGAFFLLNNMNWYWTNSVIINYNSFNFTPSNSGISSFARLNWKPQNSIQSYYYNVSALIDILTKREFLYREYLANNSKSLSLPFYLTSNPNNPLINEIKASFLYSDPVSLTNEYSRELHYNSLKFFNFIVLKNFLNGVESFLNVSLLTNYIYYYFFNDSSLNANIKNDLYKSQYRPLRKGITNMIRLHATGAVAMPIEIRLQVLASSKDVIHSWAIPSAGIKIDCVPGYSSHKVMIFLVSGIFWGQCMEICGRYHHWMPIVIYFMKRDLFFLWCTHFVFLSGANNMWNINDRQYTDYIRQVSYDKYSWVNELNN